MLAGWLASIDITRISGHGRVTVLRAHHRLAAHFQAERYRAMAAISENRHQIEDDFEHAESSASAEVGLALRSTRRAADHDLGFAQYLWQRYPRIGEAFAAGQVDQRRAKVIVTGISNLPQQEADAIVDRVFLQAPRLTTGQLAARIARCVSRPTRRPLRTATGRPMTSEGW